MRIMTGRPITKIENDVLNCIIDETITSIENIPAKSKAAREALRRALETLVNKKYVENFEGSFKITETGIIERKRYIKIKSNSDDLLDRAEHCLLQLMNSPEGYAGWEYLKSNGVFFGTLRHVLRLNYCLEMGFDLYKITDSGQNFLKTVKLKKTKRSR